MSKQPQIIGRIRKGEILAAKQEAARKEIEPLLNSPFLQERINGDLALHITQEREDGSYEMASLNITAMDKESRIDMQSRVTFDPQVVQVFHKTQHKVNPPIGMSYEDLIDDYMTKVLIAVEENENPFDRFLDSRGRG